MSRQFFRARSALHATARTAALRKIHEIIRHEIAQHQGFRQASMPFSACLPCGAEAFAFLMRRRAPFACGQIIIEEDFRLRGEQGAPVDRQVERAHGLAVETSVHMDQYVRRAAVKRPRLRPASSWPPTLRPPKSSISTGPASARRRRMVGRGWPFSRRKLRKSTNS